MLYLVILLSIIGIAFGIIKKKSKNIVAEKILVSDDVLEQQILFFTTLSPADKKLFKQKITLFLQQVIITPVNTTLSNLDKILIAAGAVIPVFRFAQWEYFQLKEVLIYPDTFNMDFVTTGEDRNIAGLVGTGVFEGKMLLSKAALQHSFNNNTDKRNTIIHEFVHLIDKTDGDTDGIPHILLDKQYALPWLNLIHEEMKEMLKGNSDIDDYGLTNKAEFFAVAAEYFFECPNLLQEKHPRLFDILQKIFLNERV